MKAEKKEIEATVQALSDGQAAKYQLPQTFGGEVCWIELNRSGKGKKYNLYLEKVVDGQPCGKKVLQFDSDKPKELASWVNNCCGVTVK